jgi:DNA polymerase-3 subunit delta
MKIPFQQLSGSLGKHLAPVYFISGDEPFQIDEACRMVRTAAVAQGYTEREIYHVERGFDWNQLIEASNTLSLFAERKVIELRLPSAKPGTDGAKVLVEYLQNPPHDTLLLIISGKLESGQLNSKWLKSSESAGVFVQVWPIDSERLPSWVQQALARRNMTASPDALALLADRIEGNLLAADQEIEKLRLLYGACALDADMVREAVTQSARFDVFSLVDAALAGQGERVARIVFGLRAEGIEPILVLWALAREIRSLAQMSQTVSRGGDIEKAMFTERVWDKRKSLVRKALQRLSLLQLSQWVMRCGQLDRITKGFGAGRIWDDLLELALALAGSPALVKQTR